MHFFLLVAMAGSFIVAHSSRSNDTQRTAANLVNAYTLRAYLASFGIPPAEQHKVIKAAIRGWLHELRPPRLTN